MMALGWEDYISVTSLAPIFEVLHLRFVLSFIAGSPTRTRTNRQRTGIQILPSWSLSLMQFHSTPDRDVEALKADMGRMQAQLRSLWPWAQGLVFAPIQVLLDGLSCEEWKGSIFEGNGLEDYVQQLELRERQHLATPSNGNFPDFALDHSGLRPCSSWRDDVSA
jgi:hypothetical protein